MKCFAILAACLLMLLSLPSFGQNFDSRLVIGEEYAKQRVQQVAKRMRDSPLEPPFFKNLLTGKEVAIATAEPILFDVFGKGNIVRQHPYEVYLVDGFWYISGTLPKGWKGGTFEIIMDASNCRVLELTHGK